MPSPYIIKIKCDLYLVRFLEKLYGPAPISFPKNSNFNNILDVFLEKRPFDPDLLDKQDTTGTFLELRLPFFEDKNVSSYNYLSPSKQRIFIKEVWKYFKITFRSEIARHVVLGLDRKDAIELFIEKYDLPVDTWDLLEKDFQRYIVLRRKKKLFRTKINSSVDDPVCPPGL